MLSNEECVEILKRLKFETEDERIWSIINNAIEKMKELQC